MTAPRVKPMGCADCDAPLPQWKRRPGLFCSDDCRKRFRRREMVRGGRLPVLVRAWRLGRNTKSAKGRQLAADALAEICRLADEWNAEDATAGRPKALAVIDAQIRLGYREQR